MTVMQYYKAMRVAINLKWSRRDREELQSGSHYWKGRHSRLIKTDLKQLKRDFTKAIREHKSRA